MSDRVVVHRSPLRGCGLESPVPGIQELDCHRGLTGLRIPQGRDQRVLGSPHAEVDEAVERRQRSGFPKQRENRVDVVDSHTGGEPTRVVVAGGRRLLSFRSERSAACIVDWDPVARRLVPETPRRIDL